MTKEKTPPDPPPADDAPPQSASADPAPSLEDLAKRYLDLWQDQWLAVSQDPQFADAMSRMAKAFTPPPGAAMPGGLPAGFGQMGGGQKGTGNDAAPPWPFFWPAPGAPAPPGTAPAGPASGHGAGGSADLAARVASLEKRLAALEASARTARKRVAATPRKR